MPWLKIVVITAYASIETAVEAMKAGATDYLPKPFTPAQVKLAIYKAFDIRNLEPGLLIPLDAVTASASGLDPHISVKSALLQAGRVAKARGIDEEAIGEKIASPMESRDLGIFGEPRQDVLLLNLDLLSK